MKITRIEIDKLYGHLDKLIYFNENINLLVGINGSGKTSILKIINLVLKPNIEMLKKIEFNSIKLYFENENNKHRLFYTKTESELTVDLYIGRESCPPMVFPLQFDLSISDSYYFDEDLQQIKMINNINSNKVDFNIIEYIEKLDKPYFIGLDRYVAVEKKRYLHNNKTSLKRPSVTKPLLGVQSLIIDKYDEYYKSVSQSDNDFKKESLLSLFTQSITMKSYTFNQIKKFRSQINDLINNDRFKEMPYYSELFEKFSEFNELIERALLSRKKVQKDSDNGNLLLDVLYRLSLIENILSLANDNLANREIAFSEIDKFFKSVNLFFKDSYKELYFNNQKKHLEIRILNSQHRIIRKNEPIENLSSGERQILILLSYIAFNKEKKVIIIDEPELSLHQRWQEIFIKELQNLMNDNTQFIIATHSSSIVGKNQRKYCKVLMPQGGDINEL